MIKVFEKNILFKGFTNDNNEVWIPITRGYNVCDGYKPIEETEIKELNFSDLVKLINNGLIDGDIKRNCIIVYDINGNKYTIKENEVIRFKTTNKEVFLTLKELINVLPINELVPYIQDIITRFGRRD